MPDSILESIIGRIQTIMQGIPNIGNVYGYVRYVKNTPDFNSLFHHAATETYRFWEIHRQASTESYHAGGSTGVTTRNHIIVVDGYHSVDDSAASESTFQSLVEDVCDAFRGQTKLNNLSSSLIDSGLMNVETVDAVKFGDRLLHHARMTIRVSERINY